MATRSDTDKAIRNIMKWADRPEWADEMDSVVDSHLSPLCDQLDVGREEITEELAGHGYEGMLFGIMFEDFLSRSLPPDGRNIVEDYLKRRGWRETAPGRSYLKKLRDSVLSLYEVVEVSPGEHCDLRDLVRDRDGEVIRVFEKMGTQNLVKWDQLAARVLSKNGRYIFSGGILPFPREAAQSLLGVLKESQSQFNKELSRAADKATVDKVLSSVNQDDVFLQDSCPAFTFIWLMHTLDRLNEPLPELVNRDGEALLFSETRFPFLAEQGDEITQRLGATTEWERDPSDDYSWIWTSEPDASGNNSPQGIAFETLRDGQRPLYGTLELKPGVLKFTAHSMERAQRGQDMLESLLQGLIGPALSKLQTPEQLLAEDQQQGDDQRESIDSIDPEIAAELIQNTLDQHYRRTLDEPIPALDNKTPRQCSRSKKGREKVIEWLKHLENNELRRATGQGQAPYDSRWMWEELNLARYRD